MEFWLSRSLSHELFFFTMEFWLSRSLSHELFFHTMKSRLSRSLFTNISFTRWNLGYHGAFSRISLSHYGTSAVTEPFHEFFFHTMESTKCTIWGKTLFIYITKSIYIGSASLKTLPLDLEPPLQGKEYGPPYSNEIAEKKANVFVPEITYRFVTRLLFF
jgi:hypothetical protein